MPIQLNNPIIKTENVTRLSSPLKENNTDWVTWWYCGLYKNQFANSQPNVLVAFRELLDGYLSDNLIYRNIPLTALGQVRVGSIWHAGVSRSSIVYEESDFDIDFCTTEWCHTSFRDTYNQRTQPPYPHNLYQLQHKTDQNWLIEFKLKKTGGKLLVPCLEFFTRCYGRSKEICRILATYPWEEARNRLYAPIDEPEEPRKWKVKLRKRLRNGDTVLLAHTKYDLYTRKRAKEIHSHIEDNYRPESKLPLFIKIAPWFQGPSEIRCQGIWFDDHRSFLALNVIGCSDPDGILIERDRENSRKRSPGDPSETEGEAWSGAVESQLKRPPDIVDLTSEAEPDHGSENIEIHDPSFVLLGIPRVIIDRKGDRVTERTGKKVKGSEATTYSGGDEYGAGKNVGYASIHAPAVIDSHGTLMDMWNAMLHLKKAYPGIINAVEWFTFDGGYNSEGSPHLIALDPFEADIEESIPTQTRNWRFYDVSTAQPRGVMVSRLTISGSKVIIVELQRRPIKKRNENDEILDAEEPYRGFVTIIEDDTEFRYWLRRFLSDVRYIRGIVSKLIAYSPGKADAFNHPKALANQMPGEPSVLNALGKVDIKLYNERT